MLDAVFIRLQTFITWSVERKDYCLYKAAWVNWACRQCGLDSTPCGLFFCLSFSSGHRAPCLVCKHLKALSYLKGLRKPALRTFSYVCIHSLVSVTWFYLSSNALLAVHFCASVFLCRLASACLSVWQSKGVGGWVCSYCKVISQAVKEANYMLFGR